MKFIHTSDLHLSSEMESRLPPEKARARRKELIAHLGIPFEICVSDADERLDGPLSPAETVKELSKRKAKAVAATHPDDIILGVDTVVSIDGRILGKPKDTEDARAMLRLLSGRTHTVYSGFTLTGKAGTYSESVATRVTFAQMSDLEIESYIASREPMDKAGAYGIQGLGGRYVIGMEGDYHSVVGLPLQRIYIALRDRYGVEFK